MNEDKEGEDIIMEENLNNIEEGENKSDMKELNLLSSEHGKINEKSDSCFYSDYDIKDKVSLIIFNFINHKIIGNILMKDSIEILNYLKEAKGLEEKYKILHAELDAKYQMDQYLLDQKYEIRILGWKSQKDIIYKYLMEKEEEKLKTIKKIEKEKEQVKDQKTLESIQKTLMLAKNELMEIRSTKKIFILKNDDLERRKERSSDSRSDIGGNNGGNLRYNK